MVDCPTCFHYCKSSDPHRNMANSISVTDHYSNQRQPNSNYRNKKQTSSLNLLMNPPCHQSSTAAVDIIILLIVLGACGFLLFPYIKFLCFGIAEIGSVTISMVQEEMNHSSTLVYLSLGVSFLFAILAVWGIFLCWPRKCDNPNCQGLRKAAEFDIQLETEDCMKNLPSDDGGRGLFELGEGHHKELEAELKKMAPPNGRAVLIFRARCGCPVGRLQVLGHKKIRKAKK